MSNVEDDWNVYARKRTTSELTPWTLEWGNGEDVTKFTVSPEARAKGHPAFGDFIARNPKNHDDKWLITKEFFEQNFEPEALNF